MHPLGDAGVKSRRDPPQRHTQDNGCDEHPGDFVFQGAGAVLDEYQCDGHDHGNEACAPGHDKKHIAHRHGASEVDPNGAHTWEELFLEMPQHHQHQSAHDGLLQVAVDHQAKIHRVNRVVQRHVNTEPEQTRQHHNHELCQHQGTQDRHHIGALVQAKHPQGQNQKAGVAQQGGGPSWGGCFGPKHRQGHPTQCGINGPVSLKMDWDGSGKSGWLGSALIGAGVRAAALGQPDTLHEQGDKGQQQERLGQGHQRHAKAHRNGQGAKAQATKGAHGVGSFRVSHLEWQFWAFLGISKCFLVFLGISKCFLVFLGISRFFLALDC